MKSGTRKCRWAILKELLLRRIMSGCYEFDQLFPGIQHIADEYGVSYLTASKVLKSLENEGYLRSRNGVGHFVSYIPEETALPHKVVQFIMSQREYRERRLLFLDAAALFRNHGWSVRILKCSKSDISPVLPEINSPDTYSIICGLHTPWQHFQASFGNIARRVLILGALAGNSEITSIISDEYDTIHQAMEYFAAKNRRNIAILSGYPTRELEALRLGAWRNAVHASGHSMEWIQKHSYSFAKGGNQEFSWKKEYPHLLEWLRSIQDDTDGLIVPMFHADVVTACLRCGFKISQKISVLLIAKTSPELTIDHKELPDGMPPKIDVLDHNYAGHFQCALEILENCCQSESRAIGYWYFCPPGTIQKCKIVLK